jgi:hypothetical protein
VYPKQDAEQDSAAKIVPPIVPKAPWRVRRAHSLGLRVVYVVFNDGSEGIVQMEDLIHSPHAGVFATLRDSDIFNQVHVKYGTVTWLGEIDLAPEPMYEAIKRTGVYIPRAEPDEGDQSLKRA